MTEINCGTQNACEQCPLREYPSGIAHHLGRVAWQLRDTGASEASFIMASRAAGDGPAELTPEMVKATMTTADMMSATIYQLEGTQ